MKTLLAASFAKNIIVMLHLRLIDVNAFSYLGRGMTKFLHSCVSVLFSVQKTGAT